MSSSKFVYAVRQDRLGARIGNLVAAWEFAQKIGRTLILNWDDYADLQIGSFSFLDFFGNIDDRTAELGLLIDTGKHTDFYSKNSLGHAEQIEDHLGKTIEYFHSMSQSIVYFRTKRYEFEGSMASKDIDLRAELFRKLPRNKEVSDAVTEVLSKIGFSSGLAVHIREGDIADYLRNIPLDASDAEKRSLVAGFAHRYAPMQAYIAAIDLSPLVDIYVFSDSDAARAALRKKYGDRVFDLRKSIESHPLTDAQVAFCEMQIIMKMSSVICGRSAFSVVASYLSDCRIHPVFPHISSDDLWQFIAEQVEGRSDRDKIIELVLEAYYNLLPDKAASLKLLSAEGGRLRQAYIDLAALEDQLRHLDNQLRELQQNRNNELQALRERKDTRIRSLQEQIKKLQYKLADAEIHLNEVQNSRLWRLVKPLRHLTRVLYRPK